MASHLSLNGQVTDVARNCQALCLLGTVYVAATAVDQGAIHCTRDALVPLKKERFMESFCAARMIGSSGRC